jgi:transaldolase
MKLFLDSASPREIREAHSLGVLDGVTTNPTHLAKEKGDPEDVLLEICGIVNGPVSAEVVSTDLEGMVREGHHWAALHENIVVKCPCTPDGLRATRRLHDEGRRVNMTLVFSPAQALLAAKAGASFVSPFVGRLDDAATAGMHVVSDIVRIYRNYGYDCQVLAASLRHPMHVVEAAKAGADIATMPMSVFGTLVKHPLTDAGLEKFRADWDKAKKELRPETTAQPAR